ncbi:unnamed protein product [Symbiodinium sp. CCMP2592]|nr:unnamed protein product [Symbiodinium sp. CCMP2592]
MDDSGASSAPLLSDAVDSHATPCQRSRLQGNWESDLHTRAASARLPAPPISGYISDIFPDSSDDDVRDTAGPVAGGSALTARTHISSDSDTNDNRLADLYPGRVGFSGDAVRWARLRALEQGTLSSFAMEDVTVEPSTCLTRMAESAGRAFAAEARMILVRRILRVTCFPLQPTGAGSAVAHIGQAVRSKASDLVLVLSWPLHPRSGGASHVWKVPGKIRASQLSPQQTGAVFAKLVDDLLLQVWARLDWGCLSWRPWIGGRSQQGLMLAIGQVTGGWNGLGLLEALHLEAAEPHEGLPQAMDRDTARSWALKGPLVPIAPVPTGYRIREPSQVDLRAARWHGKDNRHLALKRFHTPSAQGEPSDATPAGIDDLDCGDQTEAREPTDPRLFKVGVRWDPPEFFLKAKQVQHPCQPSKAISPSLSDAMHDVLTQDPVALARRRLHVIQTIKEMKRVLAPKNLLLWRALLQAAEYDEAEDLFAGTLKEVHRGDLSGPYTEDEVTAHFGSDDWLLNPRFCIYQGENRKVRVIDDAKISGLNSAFERSFGVALMDVDCLAALLVSLAQEISSGQSRGAKLTEAAMGQWKGGTLDLSRAHKQLAIDEASRRFCVLGFKRGSEWVYFRCDVRRCSHS